MEALKLLVRELEQQLSKPEKNGVHSEDYLALTFAARLRVACSAYANARESEVVSQINEGKAPDIVGPRHEYLHRVPRLLKIFLGSLGKNYSSVKAVRAKPGMKK